MAKSYNRIPSEASPVKNRIISKLITWAATPKGMSTILLSKMAFKMAIASAISLIIAQGLRWEYPFYAVIAAIIVMSSTHGSTLKLGIQRLIGTTIGAVAGAIFAIALGSNSLSLAVCVFLTVFFASYFKFNEAAKLAGYIAAIVILSHSQSPWIYAWHRYLETFLGIAVALVVNNLIFPARAGTELRRYVSQTLVHLEEFYRLVVDCALTGNYDRPSVDVLKLSIINSLLAERELWQEVRQGQTNEPIDTRVNEAWEFLIRRIWEHILTMEHTVLARKQDNFWQILSPQITQLAQETQNAMLSLATAVKSPHSHLSLPEIEIALANATQQLNQLQKIQQANYSMDELLRFFTFFYTIEEVGRKLQRMTAMLNYSNS
ncbi:aromatic acid exporter family protein [Nostoc sp. FACHB-857]|uniref:FUSC family protein n=2 Tax=Nostoc paludosum TaxID=212362 RepID=A0ABR8KHL0_9NOSO|nr:FUSC family protein [Nostoc sp. FACHB-857]MBD2681311.1 FUSC family protein [Nostoc sp. FACHB-857]MBD2737790.1 FUSC family protein [Nostoc paludosum FACHB-159]